MYTESHFSTVKNLDRGRSSGHGAYGSDPPLNIMAFPKMAVLSGLGAGLLMLVLGWSILVSLVAGVLLFMAMGGLQYTRMVIKYLPRDIW